MSKQSEFEEWFERKRKEPPFKPFAYEDKPLLEVGWQACAERKDKELAALREICLFVLSTGTEGNYKKIPYDLKKLAISLNLIDKDSNPTKLLTGESE